jgi:hypothetical protein
MRTRDFIGKLREFGPNAYMWGVGICDCGDRPRHNNGGNYHPQVEVRYSAWWKYAITLGDTREFFPGDKWEGCSCGAAFRADEQHLHVSSARKTAQVVRKHLGEGGPLFEDSNRERCLTARNLGGSISPAPVRPPVRRTGSLHPRFQISHVAKPLAALGFFFLSERARAFALSSRHFASERDFLYVLSLFSHTQFPTTEIHDCKLQATSPTNFRYLVDPTRLIESRPYLFALIPTSH